MSSNEEVRSSGENSLKDLKIGDTKSTDSTNEAIEKLDLNNKDDEDLSKVSEESAFEEEEEEFFSGTNS